ncbi:MAG: Crp/Fnr family transcriptional regulator [Halothiobacillaceae bacterium]|nr:MAG: Crp/Fnr family transcriptional regulator [Halothiobacillaceae bacterium]
MLEQIVEENRITATRDNQHAMLSDNPCIERLLRSPFFYHLPLPYLRVLEQRLTERVVYEGETIISEGDRGDLYYLIAAGEACATRRTPQGGAVIDTTHLTQGEGFGEEAIIANAGHTTSVHMTSDGVLLTLTRHEYMTLILRPLIRWIDHSSALAMQKEGVTLLDTRMPNHFAAYNLPGSVNLPLPVLRKTVSILSNTKTYIICTDNSTQGIFAAFILATHGLDVQLLKDGFEKKPATIATLPCGDFKVAAP